MLFEKIDFTVLPDNQPMRLYHTMRSSDFLPSSTLKRKALPESRLDLASAAIVSEPNTCQKCDVFHKHLVYAFYGRPAFRFSFQGRPMEPYPVFFVFSPYTKAKPTSIYPFDSGAFCGRKYGTAYVSDNINDYALATDSTGLSVNDIPKLILQIWGNNRNYYHGNVPNSKMDQKETLQLTELDKNYLSVIYNGLYGAADTRAFTIEYVYDSCLPLESLISVYFPNGTEDKVITDTFNKLKDVCGHEVWVAALSSRGLEGTHKLPTDPFAAMSINESEQYDG